MRDRINKLPADADVSYRERLRILRERKLEDTQDKAGIRAFADGDDYGAVKPPDDYDFTPVFNHPAGTFVGYDGWSENFYRMMATHPVFIDPCDAFANRWMNCMAWTRPITFNPDLNYDYLKPEQQKYGIVPGIGADAHFGGDYAIGLTLGWGGLLEKLRKYRALNPGHDDFYDAEEKTIRGIQVWTRRTV